MIVLGANRRAGSALLAVILVASGCGASVASLPPVSSDQSISGTAASA